MSWCVRLHYLTLLYGKKILFATYGLHILNLTKKMFFLLFKVLLTTCGLAYYKSTALFQVVISRSWYLSTYDIQANVAPDWLHQKVKGGSFPFRTILTVFCIVPILRLLPSDKHTREPICTHNRLRVNERSVRMFTSFQSSGHRGIIDELLRVPTPSITAQVGGNIQTEQNRSSIWIYLGLLKKSVLYEEIKGLKTQSVHYYYFI